MQACQAGARAVRPALRRVVGATRFALQFPRQYPGALCHASSSGASTSAPSWDLRMLYDGECPLCLKEVNFLRGRDTGKNKIDFVDIADASYDPASNAGITFEQAMERIHAILPDGKIVRDVEVFRRAYEAVGLGWVYAITKNEGVLAAANAVYGVWARYRMEVTGREALSIILERRKLQGKGSCRDVDGVEQCEIPASSSSAKQ